MSWPHSFQSFRSAFKRPDTSAVLVAESTLQIQAKVTSVFPEYRQARASDDEGFEYALTSSTPGVDVHRLEEGQRLQCTVEADLRRVLHAEVLA